MMTMPPMMPAMTPREARPNIQSTPMAMIPSTARVWPKGPRIKVYLESDKYLVRNVTIADASDRWGSWMADPEVSSMLNAPAKALCRMGFTR